ncbi:MAG: hypothetical protein AB8F78_16540 [Saprospiraceae bacterium]
MRKTERHIKKRNRFSIVFPFLTIIGIGILFAFSSFYEKSWTYNWNGIRKQIKDSVKVAEYGGITSSLVGESAYRPKQFDRIRWIMKNATESELLKLTEYPDGTIKTIAYEGLIRKSDFNNKTDLVLKAIKENEYKTYFQSGCIGMELNIGEYLVDIVLQIGDNSPPPPPNGFGIKYGLSENESNRILTEYRKVPSLYR